MQADVTVHRVQEALGHGGEDLESEGLSEPAAGVLHSTTALNTMAR